MPGNLYRFDKPILEATDKTADTTGNTYEINHQGVLTDPRGTLLVAQVYVELTNSPVDGDSAVVTLQTSADKVSWVDLDDVTVNHTTTSTTTVLDPSVMFQYVRAVLDVTLTGGAKATAKVVLASTTPVSITKVS